MSRPAAGGGRWVSVDPERLAAWLDGFAARHGTLEWSAGPERVEVRAADGALAACEVPLPPLAVDPAAPFGGLLAHALAERTVGVLLVRLGGFAAGVFTASRLVASRTGSRPVHGRAAAGGWSQQRFARRREGQARVALEAAVEAASAVLVPAAASLHTVVTGGDRRAVDGVLADPRLAPLRPLLSARLLDVPDPRRRVLEDTPRLFRAVSIRVVDG
ncbi:MAG TPA: acVLRF1 family peptidyl-tRNA hydrolase [Candidatus Dormibacteraeota bacterium]